jgi:hypothetical protein
MKQQMIKPLQRSARHFANCVVRRRTSAEICWLQTATFAPSICCRFAFSSANFLIYPFEFNDLRNFSGTWKALARYLLNGNRARIKRLDTNHLPSRRNTMKTLTIKDLARTEQLDRTAMSTVRGGWSMYSPSSYKVGDVNYAPSFDNSLHATQNLGQMQEVITPTANGSAFIDGVSVNNSVTQHGENKIVCR